MVYVSSARPSTDLGRGAPAQAVVVDAVVARGATRLRPTQSRPSAPSSPQACTPSLSSSALPDFEVVVAGVAANLDRRRWLRCSAHTREAAHESDRGEAAADSPSDRRCAVRVCRARAVNRRAQCIAWLEPAASVAVGSRRSLLQRGDASDVPIAWRAVAAPGRRTNAGHPGCVLTVTIDARVTPRSSWYCRIGSTPWLLPIASPS